MVAETLLTHICSDLTQVSIPIEDGLQQSVTFTHALKGSSTFVPTHDDEDISASDTTTPSIEVQGPIARSRAQQLCREVISFLCSSANDLENRLLPNDLIVIRNQRVDHGGLVGHQEGAGESRKHTQQR
jgi:hypothetical protein